MSKQWGWLAVAGLVTTFVGTSLVSSQLSASKDDSRSSKKSKHTSELTAMASDASSKHSSSSSSIVLIDQPLPASSSMVPSDFPETREVFFTVLLPSSRIRHPCSALKLKLNQSFITIKGGFTRDHTNQTLIWRASPQVDNMVLEQKLYGKYYLSDAQTGITHMGMMIDEPRHCHHILYCYYGLSPSSSFYLYLSYTMHLNAQGDVIVHPRTVRLEHDCDQLTLMDRDSLLAREKWIIPDATMAGSQQLISYLVETPMPLEKAGRWRHPLIHKPILARQDSHGQGIQIKNSLKILKYSDNPDQVSVIQRLMNHKDLVVRCHKITYKAEPVAPLIQNDACYGLFYLFQSIPFRGASESCDFTAHLIFQADHKSDGKFTPLLTCLSSDLCTDLIIVFKDTQVKQVVRTDVKLKASSKDKEMTLKLDRALIVLEQQQRRVLCLKLTVGADAVSQSIEIDGSGAEVSVRFYHFGLAILATITENGESVALQAYTP